MTRSNAGRRRRARSAAGLLQRLDALERLFETEREWRERMTYIQKASESRSSIPAYETLQTDVVSAVERINRRFGTKDWQPIVYIDQFLPHEELCGLYRRSDVMLVSALRDGMNLVAKEYIAAQTDGDGILVLSNQTGAHDELGEYALSINPYDVDEFACRIDDALRMTASERWRRMKELRRRVTAYDVFDWSDEILETAHTLSDDGP